jgi:two-component system nitrate/nitrite response regulator NarP
MRIIVADDHPMVRAAISALLVGHGHQILAEVASGAAALSAIATHDPDAVLLDVSMPDGSGVELLTSLRQSGDTRIIILVTALLDTSDHHQALAAGASGIFLKSSDPELLLECLETVQKGSQWLDPTLGVVGADTRFASISVTLSPRELEVAELVAQGLRNKEIAQRLGITEGTVKVYLHAMFEKLEVRTRTELAMLIGEPDVAKK